jgi:hypothetical protein
MLLETCSEHVGTRVTGVDIRLPLSDAEVVAIRTALADTGVVVIPSEGLSERQQVAFTGQFGACQPHPNTVMTMKAMRRRARSQGGAFEDRVPVWPLPAPPLTTKAATPTGDEGAARRRASAAAKAAAARTLAVEQGEQGPKILGWNAAFEAERRANGFVTPSGGCRYCVAVVCVC